MAIRNHISTLKHSVRQQQAQIHSLENIILRGPRPLPLGFMPSSNHTHHHSEDVLDIGHPPVAFNNFSTPKMQRRSSFDVLHGLAGPDSSLPLPKRESLTPISKTTESIREGIPIDLAQTHFAKRMSSPTRTLSRTFFPSE